MITLLMSVYKGEDPAFLEAAFASIAAQTSAPEEFLLVKDGPLSAALDQVIADHQAPLNIKTLALEKNLGLAEALNHGLRAAKQPWVMRFDTDDICAPHRIAEQRKMMMADQVDLFGSQIAEFDDDPEAPHRARTVPLNHAEILGFSQQRNPFNHMTVCYRRQLALDCGGYPAVPYMEDYALWVAMLARGARASNSAEAFVLARVGAGMIGRRGGYRYALSEFKLRRLMVQTGHQSLLPALSIGLMRAAVFVMPTWLRKLVYSTALRKRVGPKNQSDGSTS
ncbi:MAG: glycosyltransferase [Pseudomonadota bacterium]